MKKVLISIIGVAILVFTLCFCASAANVCTYTGGTVADSVTFEFSTGNKIFGSESIKLTQTKGKIHQHAYHSSEERDIWSYGRYYVTVYDKTKNKYVYDNKKWTDKTFTISTLKLHNNRTYKVTVTGSPYDGILEFQYNNFWWRHVDWVSYSSWSVTKTGSNITVCF